MLDEKIEVRILLASKDRTMSNNCKAKYKGKNSFIYRSSNDTYKSI